MTHLLTMMTVTIKRKSLLILVVLLLIGIVSGCQTNTSKKLEYEALFEEELLEINIEIAESDWLDIINNPLEKEYKSVNFKIGDYSLENVALRTKGGSTLKNIASNENSDRYSFRLNFGKFNDGQTLAGLDNMVLNNNFADPSYLREHFTYEALRSIGGKAPLFTFANVYLNGELIGLYYVGELIEEGYVKRNFSQEGNLYKAEDDVDFILKDPEHSYPNYEHKLGTDEDKVALKHMLQVLHDTPVGEKGELESVLDVDSFLKYFALNSVMMSYDSYNGPFANNFYLYEQSGVFHLLPWDYNMSIDGFSPKTIGKDESVNDYLESLRTDNVSIMTPIYHTTLAERPLVQKLLAIDEYQEKYLGYVEDLLVYLEDFDKKVLEKSNFIRLHVEADPTRLHSMASFDQAVGQEYVFVTEVLDYDSYKSYRINKESIVALIERRVEFIKEELGKLK